MSSNNSTPKNERPDRDSSHKRFGVLGITSSNASPQLQVQERILNEMAQLVERLIIGALNPSVLFRRNNCYHSLLLGLSDNRIRIIATVS